MQDDRFEWDDAKAAQNLSKHKVSFEDARLVFDDPHVFDKLDDTLDYGEERFLAIGMVEGVLLTVVYTERENRQRIISARKAARNERQDYFSQNPAA